jgi:hypothetical protein
MKKCPFTWGEGGTPLTVLGNKKNRRTTKKTSWLKMFSNKVPHVPLHPLLKKILDLPLSVS